MLSELDLDTLRFLRIPKTEDAIRVSWGPVDLFGEGKETCILQQELGQYYLSNQGESSIGRIGREIKECITN